MNNLNLRSTGATIVSQSGDPGPVELVKETITKMPEATRNARFEKFREQLAGYEDYQRIVDHYFFVNMHDYLTTNRSASKRGNTAATPRQKLERDKAVEAVKQRILAMSLDFVMPSGKTLRDSTGTECMKAGGWLAKIGKAVGSKRVGNVIKTDEALQKALKGR